MNYEGDPNTHKPHSTIKGRTAIRSALAVLNTFKVTLHMNGQSDVVIQGNRAIGETYCVVHQFTGEKDQRKCQTLGIRYYDQFLRQENRWYFTERKLVIDWSRHSYFHSVNAIGVSFMPERSGSVASPSLENFDADPDACIGP